jgi:succinate dehydrogenase hydrophobic anchor subunit
MKGKLRIYKHCDLHRTERLLKQMLVNYKLWVRRQMQQYFSNVSLLLLLLLNTYYMFRPLRAIIRRNINTS